ncbi:HCaRG [Plasmopara halstedii]|uniref:HCaRG n=1 Tax=Plasmopara halstedii TaxID=4781 RepID=A0A0P1ABN5_PLAHL|nr:HCaRG [Plasmopara halstedii]CEG37980.1 HCaRG [Plasmopara halstedii]|eukprot:XP_024574349.1 HCaRG [Plasmopara halstedii]
MNVESMRDFDYSMRMNVANSLLCEDHYPSLLVKLHLSKHDEIERQVMLEFSREQLTLLLQDFKHIYQELQKS